MERRPGEQRLKFDERQRRLAHIHGHPGPVLSQPHRGPHHLHHPLPRHLQGLSRGQLHPLHQDHRQARKGFRQQIPRVHQGGEGKGPAPHVQNDGSPAALLVPPMDQKPDGTNEGRQQAEAVDGRPQGHGAQEHPAGPGAGPAQGEEQQAAPQQQGRGEQRQQGSKILPAADEQRRDQQTAHPPRGAQEPRPSAQRRQIPARSQQGRERGAARAQRYAAQGPGQLQQEPVHREVVQQKPL